MTLSVSKSCLLLMNDIEKHSDAIFVLVKQPSVLDDLLKDGNLNDIQRSALLIIKHDTDYKESLKHALDFERFCEIERQKISNSDTEVIFLEGIPLSFMKIPSISYCNRIVYMELIKGETGPTELKELVRRTESWIPRDISERDVMKWNVISYLRRLALMEKSLSLLTSAVEKTKELNEEELSNSCIKSYCKIFLENADKELEMMAKYEEQYTTLCEFGDSSELP